MSDRDWRALERAWEANPGDQRSLAAYVRALFAAERPVDTELLDQVVHPAARVDLPVVARLSYREQGTERWRNRWCPCPDPAGWALPERTRTSVFLPRPTPEQLREVVPRLNAQGIPHLLLDCERLTKGSLAALEGYERLERLALLRPRELSARDLAPLRDLPRLSALRLNARLRGSTQLLVEALPSGLTSLTFQGERLEDGHMARLAGLPLRSLCLDASGLGRPGLEALSRAVDLRRLTLESYAAEDGDLQALRSVPLRELSLRDPPGWVDDACLAEVASCFPHLESLDVEGPFGDDGLAALGALPLRKLQIRSDAVSTLDALPGSLEGLGVYGGRRGGRRRRVRLEGLSALTRLEDLTLFLEARHGAPLQPLGDLPELRQLFLSLPGGQDRDLAPLRGLEQVRYLFLSGSFGDPAVECFRHLPLSSLTLSLSRPQEGRTGEVGPSDAGVELLAGMSSLGSLDLSNAHRVGLEGCRVIARLPELISFHAWDCGAIGDQALSALARSPSLQDLSLGYCAGIEGAGLVEVAKAGRVRTLAVTQCGLEAGTTDAVRAALSAPCELRVDD